MGWFNHHLEECFHPFHPIKKVKPCEPWHFVAATLEGVGRTQWLVVGCRCFERPYSAAIGVIGVILLMEEILYQF